MSSPPDILGLLQNLRHYHAPLWDQFWRNPFLSAKDTRLFQRFRRRAFIALAEQKKTLDYGLIHADLVPTKVMIAGQKIKLIYFDDGGFGYRLFDIGTALHKFTSAPDYPSLRTAWIAGYSKARRIDLALLDLFSVIRAVTYVG